jgi:hypothetical protein
LIKEYRKVLWADHFRHDKVDDFEDIRSSLNAWENGWGSRGSAPARPDLLELISLPLPDVKMSPAEKEQYDLLYEVDSKETWSICIPPKDE